MSGILNYDIALLRWIQANRIECLDSFFYWLSYSTTHVSIGIVITMLIAIKTSWLSKSKVLDFFALFTASILINLAMKYSFARSRPFVTYSDIEKLYDASLFSFPSGHTITAFAIAFGSIMMQLKRRYIISLFCWAFLVAYSRMVLGSHYPTDILTGMFIVFVIYIIIKQLHKRK